MKGRGDPERRKPAVTPAEENRQAMHRAVDRVLGAWPKAIDDAEAIGFPRGRGYDTAGGGRSGFTVDTGGDLEFVPATGVELAALHPTIAVAWVAELHDVVMAVTSAAWPARAWSLTWTPQALGPVLHAAVDRLADRFPAGGQVRRDLYRLADMAALHWPPPPKKGDKAGTVTVGERGNTVELCKLCQEPVLGGHHDPCARIDGDPYHTSCAKVVQISRGTHPGLKHEHGTVNRYNAGCHCDECRGALAAYHRARRRARTVQAVDMPAAGSAA